MHTELLHVYDIVVYYEIRIFFGVSLFLLRLDFELHLPTRLSFEELIINNKD